MLATYINLANPSRSLPLPSNRERNISPEILGVHRSFSTMAISSHSTSQPDQNPQAEHHLEDQQQQRCICQGHFSHNEHQKWPALFSPVAQQLTEMGFTYIAVVYALGFGVVGEWAAVASIRALPIAEHNNALSNTAKWLALLQICLGNSACSPNTLLCIYICR